ncbi:MAG: cytochrome-c peroxidase, partial [Hyphomicrobiaceae bacterium]
RQDKQAAARFPEDAQRGAALFVGRGKCSFCHTGPLFSNGEFANAGVRYFTGPGRVDPGRHGGIKKLKASRFNLLGAFNDAPDKTNAWATRQLAKQHKTFGEFKVPSLRNLTRTAPYMHNGALATLEDVVQHYSTIDLERLHSDGERILEPLRLNRQESADLVAFLKTLSTAP